MRPITMTKACLPFPNSQSSTRLLNARCHIKGRMQLSFARINYAIPGSSCPLNFAFR